MRIAIDCRSLRKKPAGVPNFLISVINTIALKPEVTLYLLSNEDFSPEVQERLNQHPSVNTIISPFWLLPRIAIIWYLIKLPFLVKKFQVDFFYTPIPNLPFLFSKKVKTLVTVHDMVFKKFPKTMSMGNWWINFLLHNYSVRTADYIWAISNYTKSEIERCYPIRKTNLIFVGSSIDKSIFYKREISNEHKNQFFIDLGLGERFILFVGTLEPRKNIKFLISLVPELTKHGFDVLIVGARGWGKNEIDQLKTLTEYQKSKVKFSGFISTEKLVLSYHLAKVYVSTSLNEGFGLPQLEAMNCGCPVVSPHNSAMIEIVDGAGETVKSWDIKDWISAILKVTENRDRYAVLGLKRASSYDWSNLIENLITYLQSGKLSSHKD